MRNLWDIIAIPLGLCALLYSVGNLTYRMATDRWSIGSLGMPEPIRDDANPLEMLLIDSGRYQVVTLISFLVILGCTGFMTWLIRADLRLQRDKQRLRAKLTELNSNTTRCD